MVDLFRTGVRRRSIRLSAGLLVLLVPVACAGSGEVPKDRPTSASRSAVSPRSGYDQLVLSLKPILYLPLDSTSRIQVDRTGNGNDGTLIGSHGELLSMPNGDRALLFVNSLHAEIPSTPAISFPSEGVLSIQVWIAPSVRNFAHTEGSGYVYYLGKGSPGRQEYALRIYSYINDESPPRPNRISAYVFSPNGGLGSGAYFQDPIQIGQWIMITVEIDTADRTPEFPSGSIAIFKDGVLRQRTSLEQYPIHPAPGAADLSIGTLDGDSFFQGGIGKVAIFDYQLSSEVLSHEYLAMVGR